MSMRLVARLVAVTVIVVAGTIGGMLLGLQVGAPHQYDTSVSSIRTSVRAARDGHVVVYVPLVDWRVRLIDHDAPVTITIELRGIDRDSAGAGVSSAAAAARSLEAVRADTRTVIEATIERAMVAAAIGGLAGSSVAGALLAGLLLRRRWLVLAPLFGALIVAAVELPTARALSGIDAQHLEVVAAGGHADELPVVLRFAEQLLSVGEDYEQHYETALSSIANLARFAGDERPTTRDEALLVSDLHDNVFVLDALHRFVGDDVTVFAAGDFVQVGARLEQRTARRVARLGGRVIAVSGNHDTPGYMAELDRSGAEVLDTERPAVRFGGLTVAGMPDPLQRSDDAHRLRVYGDEYRRQQEDVVDWWDSLDERPDVVLVHQHGFAHHLARVLEQRGDRRPLVLLTGHDHEPHVHATGPHVIVDGGSVGAGGLAAVGEQDASFAQLSFAEDRLVEVTILSIEPLTGRARSERTPISWPAP